MKPVKRWALLFLLLILTACGGREGGDEVVVFAAASLEEALTEIGARYMAQRDHVSIVINFDSSGTLKTQIQEGADCGLFISAGQGQMDQLEAEGFLLDGSRSDLLENTVVLAVPEDNPAGLRSFEQLRSALEEGTVLLAMGSGDVPVGQYTQKIFAYWGLEEDDLAASGCLTYGSNVKEVATQVAEGTVDCGIVYGTDAYSAGLTVVDAAGPEMCGRAIYPAAILAGGRNLDGAGDFLDFLRTDQAAEVFSRVGFTPLR